MDSKLAQEALSRIVNGVYILTVKTDKEKNGMPVSWVTQVSKNPPLIVVGISAKRYSHDLIDSVGEFTLNLLSLEQAKLVDQFKFPGPDKDQKFSDVPLEEGRIVAAPSFAESPVSIECRVHTAYTPGDHTLFIGEVVAVTVRNDEPALDIESYGKPYLGGD